MQKFEKMYFAEFHLRNVSQIQIKSNNQLRVGLGLHLSLESTSAHHKQRDHAVGEVITY